MVRHGGAPANTIIIIFLMISGAGVLWLSSESKSFSTWCQTTVAHTVSPLLRHGECRCVDPFSQTASHGGQGGAEEADRARREEQQDEPPQDSEPMAENHASGQGAERDEGRGGVLSDATDRHRYATACVSRFNAASIFMSTWGTSP